MRFFIQGKEVDQEQFETEFKKELDIYQPRTDSWPIKEKVRDALAEKRYFNFPQKCEKCGSLYRKFEAVEEDICKMAEIIDLNKFDDFSDDAVPIAVALHNAGYTLVKKEI